MKKILPLTAGIRYTLEDVTKIYTQRSRSGRGSYYALEIVLSYFDGVVKRRKYLSDADGVNIQFAQNLHIGAELDDKSEYIPDSWQFFDLPIEICSISRIAKKDVDYLAKEFLFKFSKKVGNNWVENLHSTRIAIYEFQEPVLIQGRQVHYVTIPSFEIARYFLFDSNLYNHYLIETEFGSEDRKNCIYNPKVTGVLDASNGDEVKYVQLRREIDDSCSQRAGDLAFQPKFREQAMALGNRLRSFSNIRTFAHIELPIETFEKFSGLGVFTENFKGQVGISLKVITNVTGYSDKYVYSRDNDGRTVREGNPNLKPTVGGPQRPSPPVDDPEETDVDNNELGDPSIEREDIVLMSEFDKFVRVDCTEKIEKVTQEYTSKGHSFLPNQEVIGVGGLSGEGGSGSSHQGADNTPVDSKFITPYHYWLNFYKLITRIKEEWPEISIKYLQLKDGRIGFHQERCKQRMTFRSKLKLVSIDYYLIELELNGRFCYLIEFNQSQIDNGLSLSVFHSSFEDISHEIQRVLRKLSNKRGNSSQLRKKSLFYTVNTVKHRIYGGKSRQDKGPAPRLLIDDAIEGFNLRVIMNLKTFFS